LPTDKRSGLRVVQQILTGIDGVTFVELTSRDVVRHRIVASIVDAYQKFESKR
jgi:phosphate starvation-inducible PhoH-like protein